MRFRLPAGTPSTVLVWIVVLLLVSVVGALWDGPRQGRAQAAAGLDGAQFSRYQSAEMQTRIALGFGSSAVPVDDWERLARDSAVAGMNRRALVALALAGRPFDPSLVDDLMADQTAAGVPADEVRAEARLWRSLYGPKGSPAVPRDAEARIAALRIGLLGERAAADAVRRRDGATAARPRETAFAASSRSAAMRLLTLLVVPLVLGLFGVALGLWTLVTASGRFRWTAVGAVAALGLAGAGWAGRQASVAAGIEVGIVAGFFAGAVAVALFVLAVVAALRERHWMPGVPVPGGLRGGPGWGDWADGFLCYLALYRLAQLGAAMALSGDRSVLVPALAAAQFGSGIAAMAYLAWRLRRRGHRLTAMGWTARRLPGDILCGIGGYAMLLPVVGVLGQISQRLFENSSNTAPNPVIPLLASAGASERFWLFLMAAVAAPLLEEFFFRGALYTAFRERWRWLPSALLSSAVFASLHPVQDWLPIVGLGFGFAAMRERRGSLVPGIVAHALQNGMASLLATQLFGG